MNKREQIIEVLAKYYPNFANIEKVANDIIALDKQGNSNPHKEQNDRMREWFKHRTGLSTDFLQDHMMKMDEMLHGWYPIKFVEWVGENCTRVEFTKEWIYHYSPMEDLFYNSTDELYEYWLKKIK